jgi:hypothetical protein
VFSTLSFKGLLLLDYSIRKRHRKFQVNIFIPSIFISQLKHQALATNKVKNPPAPKVLRKNYDVGTA